MFRPTRGETIDAAYARVLEWAEHYQYHRQTKKFAMEYDAYKAFLLSIKNELADMYDAGYSDGKERK